MADTWDEAACRARLVAAAKPYDVIACRELDRHAAADLEAALAALDAARVECDRLRAALREAVEVAECHAGEELVELRRAAAALGGRP